MKLAGLDPEEGLPGKLHFLCLPTFFSWIWRKAFQSAASAVFPGRSLQAQAPEDSKGRQPLEYLSGTGFKICSGSFVGRIFQ
ncbi:hypothetical protein [Methanosarcina acetivorans]|uniref:hypothetical protein n=1 Tax=Methanosarcina acetivorans TaxID=2214 RepID=UPI00064F7A4D|nr:hypothetical protein [Methanosarcina acetivorans]